MKNKIKSYIDRLSIVDKNLDFSEKLKIEIITICILFGLTLSALHEIVSMLVLPFTIVHFITNGLWVVGFIVAAYFLYQKKYDLTGKTLFYFSLASTAIIHFVFGVTFELEVTYLLIVFLSNYFFKGENGWKYIALIILTHAIIVIALAYIAAPYSHLAYSHLNATYFLFSLVLTANVATTVITEYETYQTIAREEQLKFQEKNEQLKRFNYVIINDLKTPLRNIVSFATLIDRSSCPTEKKEYIDYIINNGNQLDTIIDNIRTFQEINSDEMVLEQVNINDVISSACTASNNFLKQKGIKTTIDHFPEIETYQYPLFIMFKHFIEHMIKLHDNKQSTLYFHNIGITEDQKIKIELSFMEKNTGVFAATKKIEQTESLSQFLQARIAITTLYSLGGQIYTNHSNDRKNTKYTLHIPLSIKELEAHSSNLKEF